jgi:hypothetical protein
VSAPPARPAGYSFGKETAMAEIRYLLKIDGLSQSWTRADQATGAIEVLSFSIVDRNQRMGDAHIGKRSHEFTTPREFDFVFSPSSWAYPLLLRGATEAQIFPQALFQATEASQLRYTILFSGVRLIGLFASVADPTPRATLAFDQIKIWTPDPGGGGNTQVQYLKLAAGDVELLYRREDWNRHQARALLDRTGLA